MTYPVFCAGEMLDWEAPTGGYLLTACLQVAILPGPRLRTGSIKPNVFESFDVTEEARFVEGTGRHVMDRLEFSPIS